MQNIPKQAYTAEFKEPAVKRVQDGQTVGTVAKEMGLVEPALRNRMTASDGGTRNGAGAPKVSAEAMERSRLRAENARRKRAGEILPTATAYFARAAR